MNPREKALKTNRIASLVEIAIGAVLLGIVAIFGSKMSSILYLLVGFVGLVIFLTGVLWGTMIRSRVKNAIAKTVEKSTIIKMMLHGKSQMKLSPTKL